MLDIQRMNPEAFIGGNINQLKAGYILRMPTAGDITPQSFEEAVAEVQRQTRRWQSGVSSVDRLDASEGLDVSGVAGSDSGEGHLQIAGVDSTDDTPMGGDISARMEDLDRARRENTELGTRLSAMADQMEMQERLISLKDEQIAALQEALERAGGEVEMPAEREGTIEALEAPELTPAEPAPQAQPEAAAAPPPAAPQPAPPQPVAPPQPTILDMVMQNILYIAGGVLVLVLLALFLLRDKLPLPNLPGRKKDQELPVTAAAVGGTDEFADVSLTEDSLVIDEFDEDAEGGAAEIDTPAPAAGGYSGADEQYAAQFESGDALAEADIYIAYGRFPQAVDLLKSAIAVEPANTGFRMKLMEACVEMGESGEFQQQYADMQVIGDENLLQRARSLLEAVDGGEVWLDDLPEPTISAADVEAARATMGDSGGGAAQAEDSLDLDLGLDDAGADDSDTGLDLDDTSLTEIDDDAADLGLDIEETDGGLGIDDDSTELGLELDTGSAELDDDTGIDFSSEPELEDTEDDADAALELDELLTDDDGDADEPGADDNAAALDSLTLETEDSADEPEEIELPDLELDGLADEPAAADAGDDDLLADLEGLGAELGADEAVEDLESMSLSLDDDDGDDGDLSDLGADLDDGDDLDLSGSDLDTGSDLDGVEFDLSGDNGDDNLADMELDMTAEPGEEDGLVFAADGDEIATKLDLARAYIDMGDHDGARSILQEVAEAGNEAQQGEARQLLEGID